MLEKIKNNNQGFTLLEMAVVVAIIVLVSSILYANYHGMNKQGDVIALNERIVNDLRKTENNSIHRKGWKEQIADGWGVKIDKINNKYTVFADFDGDMVLSNPVKLLIHGTEWSSGATFTESSSSGKTVSLVSTPTQINLAGRPTGTAGYWTFNGTTDGLSIPDSDDWTLSGDFTIDVWAKFNTHTGWELIVGHRVTNWWYLYHRNEGGASDGLTFSMYDGSSAKNFIGTEIADSNWHHIAVVRDNSMVSLYLDGVQVAGGKYVASVDVAGPLLIGRRGSDTTAFDGSLDDLRIVKGAALWRHNFTVPSKEHVSDLETVKTETLSRGVTIAAIVGDLGSLDSVNIFFSPRNYSTYQDGVPSIANVSIGLNNVDGTSVKTININPYGLISSD